MSEWLKSGVIKRIERDGTVVVENDDGTERNGHFALYASEDDNGVSLRVLPSDGSDGTATAAALAAAALPKARDN